MPRTNKISSRIDYSPFDFIPFIDGHYSASEKAQHARLYSLVVQISTDIAKIKTEASAGDAMSEMALQEISRSRSKAIYAQNLFEAQIIKRYLDGLSDPKTQILADMKKDLAKITEENFTHFILQSQQQFGVLDHSYSTAYNYLLIGFTQWIKAACMAFNLDDSKIEPFLKAIEAKAKELSHTEDPFPMLQGEEMPALLGNESLQEITQISPIKFNTIDYLLDKTSRNIFQNPIAEFGLDGQYTVIEIGNRNAKNETEQLYLSLRVPMLQEENVPAIKKLSAYDKRVMQAVGSLYYATEDRNHIVTVAEIYHAMGKTGNPGQRDKDNIYNSLGRLSIIRLEIIPNKNTNRVETIIDTALLSYTGQRNVTINNKITNAAIQIEKELPLYRIANQLGQLTTIPVALLNTGNNQQEMALKTEDYLLNRIICAKRGTLDRTIVLDTLYKEIDAAGANPRKRAREYAIRALERYKEEKFICDYTITADRITLDLPRQKKAKHNAKIKK